MYRGERFNSISHLIGAVFAVSGTSMLITHASFFGDVWKIVSFSIYGFTLILLYTCSTLYHSLKGRAKEVFQRLDHISIYLVIAGSYTPFALVPLRSTTGWWVFGIIWGLAIFGITQELILGKKTRILSLVLYLVMGWLVTGTFKTLKETLPAAGIFWLALGGIFYTLGVIFFVLDEKIKHGHGIWHLFVLAGSFFQFFCIFNYIA